MEVSIGCSGTCKSPKRAILSTYGVLTPQGAVSIQHSHRRAVDSFVIKHASPGVRGRHIRAFRHVLPVTAQADRQGRDWRQGLWTTIDVTATLGSVGGAIAFVLTQEAMLVGLPVVLPLLALYASRKREKAVLEVWW